MSGAKLNIILLFFMANVFFDQEIYAQKFKDIYPYVEAGIVGEAAPRLKEFLSENPDDPAANFQIAYIYDKRYQAIDPLISFNPAMENARLAKERFSKSYALVDEKEIRKHGKKYYTNFSEINEKGKEEVNYETIKHYIDSAYARIDSFLKYIPVIHKQFISANAHYDKAVKYFEAINGSYTTLKDIHLLYNDALNDSLEEMKTAYDSTLFYLDAYISGLNKHPVKNYSPNYTVEKIKNYRLDGLVHNINFLKNDFEIWNYRLWAEEIQSYVRRKINTLRDEIIENEEKLNKELSQLQRWESLPEAYEAVNVDKDLMFKLQQFDYESIVASLLNYKNSKLKYFESNLDPLFINDTIAGSPLRLRFHNDFLHQLYGHKLLIEEINGRNTPDKIAKHQSFIDKYYDGLSGVSAMVESESELIDSQMKSKAETIEQLLLFDSSRVTNTYSIDYDEFKIPTIPYHIPYSLLLPGQAITTQLETNIDSTLFVSGINMNDKKESNSFLGYINKSLAVQWIKKFDTLQNNNITGFVAGPEGIAFILNYFDSLSGQPVNRFVMVDNQGKKLFENTLSENLFPRKIIFNEISGSYLVLLKGEELKPNEQKPELVKILSLNRLGQQIWSNEFRLQGQVKDVMTIPDGYLVMGDYHGIADQSGKIVTAGIVDQESNFFTIKLSLGGKELGRKLIANKPAFFTDRYFKVSEKGIHIFGYKGVRDKIKTYDPRVEKNSMVHLVVDKDLNVIYQDF